MKYPILIRLDCVDIRVLCYDLIYAKLDVFLLQRWWCILFSSSAKSAPIQKEVIQHSTFFSDVPQYPLLPLANRNRNRRFFASICHWNDPGERQVWTLVLFIKGWKGKVETDIVWCVPQNFVRNTETFMFWECQNYYNLRRPCYLITTTSAFFDILKKTQGPKNSKLKKKLNISRKKNSRFGQALKKLSI